MQAVFSSRWPGLVSLLAAALLSACAAVGTFTWVDDWNEPAPTDDTWVLGPGDAISVRVFNQDSMSARAKVRPDGKVSLPFLNDVDVAGLTPTQLAMQLTTRLKDFVNLPVVTVSLEEPRTVPISVVGEVARQGLYQLELNANVLTALAAAGGLTDFARKDRIFVLRQRPTPVRLRFAWERLIHDEGKGRRFRLQSGDTVVVE